MKISDFIFLAGFILVLIAGALKYFLGIEATWPGLSGAGLLMASTIAD